MFAFPTRSRTGCLTCKQRRKKCDEARPVCRRCVKSGKQCLGYTDIETINAKSRRFRRRPAPDTILSSVESFQTSGSSTSLSPVDPPLLAPISSSSYVVQQDTFTSPSLTKLPYPVVAKSTTANNVPDWNNNLTMPPPSACQSNDPLTCVLNPLEMIPKPSEDELDLANLISTRLLETSSNTTNVTLDQEAFCPPLLGPEYSSTAGASSCRTLILYGATQLTPDLEDDELSRIASDGLDVEGVREVICYTPTLDWNVPSNSLPFVLQSYANWFVSVLFTPLEMANRARGSIFLRFTRSEDSRRTVIIVANVVRSLRKASRMIPGCRPAMSLLRDRAQRELALATSVAHPPAKSLQGNVTEALLLVLEVASIQLFVNGLRSNYSLIQQVAPAYRLACPEPADVPINLPHKLLHPAFPYSYFPTLDILFSLSICVPMQFRYDLTHVPELDHSPSLSQTVGVQWLTGVPGKVILILARMHMLRIDYASNVDAHIVSDVEEEIQGFQPTPYTSSDPFLAVARFAAQEAWRQTLYIYLYMGLCGANAADKRVQKALGGFIRLLQGIKPDRHPDAFLILPMTVAAIASCERQDRETVAGRMLGLYECSEPGTYGYETVTAIGEVWTRADTEARPATWMDWRAAVAAVSGIE